MSRIIKRTSEVIIEVSPEEMATIFWNMNEVEQATFFDELAEVTGSMLPFQLQAVADSPALTSRGKAIMQLIGDYGYSTKDLAK